MKRTRLFFILHPSSFRLWRKAARGCGSFRAETERTMNPLLILLCAVIAVFVLVPIIVSAFLRNVNAGEIRLVSWMGGRPKIYRGPCKAMLVPLVTVSSV